MGPPHVEIRSTIIGLDGTIHDEIPGLPADAFATSLSPDGAKVAFVTRDTSLPGCGSCLDRPRIATMNVDGSEARLLTDRWHWIDTPMWSPDGTKIAFVARGGDGNQDVYVMNADGSTIQRLTTDPTVDQDPSWSPDGSTIIYDNIGSAPVQPGGFSSAQELWTVPVAGGPPIRLTHDNFAARQPVYSPDGTRIAVTRGSLGIWLLDADGTNPRPVSVIPRLQFSPFSPRWSPDGTHLAYLFHVAFSTSSVKVLDPRGGGVQLLLRFKVGVADLTTHRVVSIGVTTASDSNGVSWLPSGDAMLVNRLTPES